MPPRDDDRRQRQREQADLDAQPRDLEGVAAAQEVAAGHAEEQRTRRAITSEQHPLVVREQALAPAARSGLRTSGSARRSASGHAAPAVRAAASETSARQDDRALDRLLPERVDADEGQRRPDRPQQRHADQRADERAAPARDRRAADDDRGDGLQLEADARRCSARPRSAPRSGSAASPSSAPISTKTPKTTRRGSMPASRAASASDPTA